MNMFKTSKQQFFEPPPSFACGKESDWAPGVTVTELNWSHQSTTWPESRAVFPCPSAEKSWCNLIYGPASNYVFTTHEPKWSNVLLQAIYGWHTTCHHLIGLTCAILWSNCSCWNDGTTIHIQKNQHKSINQHIVKVRYSSVRLTTGEKKHNKLLMARWAKLQLAAELASRRSHGRTSTVSVSSEPCFPGPPKRCKDPVLKRVLHKADMGYPVPKEMDTSWMSGL